MFQRSHSGPKASRGKEQERIEGQRHVGVRVKCLHLPAASETASAVACSSGQGRVRVEQRPPHQLNPPDNHRITNLKKLTHYIYYIISIHH